MCPAHSRKISRCVSGLTRGGQIWEVGRSEDLGCVPGTPGPNRGVIWQEWILLRVAGCLTVSATGALASAPSLLPEAHILVKFVRKKLVFVLVYMCMCVPACLGEGACSRQKRGLNHLGWSYR